MSTLITAVIVLYKRRPDESESYVSLRSLAGQIDDLASRVQLCIYDNSPEPHSPPCSPVVSCYISNPENPGLAVAYNEALRLAREVKSQWLLLLDQDTVLNASYLQESLRLAQNLPGISPQTGAILPRLVEKTKVHSPGILPRWKHQAVPRGNNGLSPVPLTAYNSGALLRVDAITAIGGFSSEFPLELLDCDTFHRLQKAGYRVWVMESELQHSLAMSQPSGSLLGRYRTMLAMEQKFYSMEAAWTPRLWYRLRKVRTMAGHMVKGRGLRFAMLDAAAALGISFKRYRQR